jgi:hypothetical protein
MVKNRKYVKLAPEFLSACDDIHELAVQRMSDRDRKMYKQHDLEKLGAAPNPNTKIPYNILQGIKKKQRERGKAAWE